VKRAADEEPGTYEKQEPPMFRVGALLISIVGFALPATAQVKETQLPENTIDCKQFKRTGPQEWIEVGTAVFDLGSIKDINLTNQPVTPRSFKFDGIDLYSVVDKKCGAITSSNQGEAVGPTPIASEQAPPPAKAEFKQAESAAPPQPPAQANITVAASETKILKGQAEITSCGDKKSVYVADGIADADRSSSLIEIAVNNNNSQNSEFIIKGYLNSKVDWAFRGKIAHERFVFESARYQQENSRTDSVFTPAHSGRQKSATVEVKYIKPNRNGTGEAILYLSGLRPLFASKESVQRFKFEGNRPLQSLPEVFYFDRCE
jgi:hypothetical protein